MGEKPASARGHLAQYIAASSFLHGADGWSYLGKAVAALLRGDPHRSRHLAYYAELRGALSVLASRGIGVLNHEHFVISSENVVSRLQIQRGTHEVVWACLELWAKRPASGEMFSSIIRPYGRELSDWLTPIGGGSAVISRASLMLRLAMGSIRKLVDEAGLPPNAMEFWSRDFGRSRGIWEGNFEGDKIDLWNDIPPLLQDVDGFQVRHGSDKQTFFRSGAELGSAIVGLASFERIALWSVTQTN